MHLSLLLHIPFAGASPIQSEFCKAFDPDRDWNGTTCGYGNGFNIGIVSALFAAAQFLLIWFWMPKDLGARYEFSSKAGYDNISASSTAAAAPMASSYQDIATSA